MDNEEFDYINAIPGAVVQGVGVIGMAVASTSGFWFEFDKEQSNWVEFGKEQSNWVEFDKEQLNWVGVDVRHVYTRYNNNK